MSRGVSSQGLKPERHGNGVGIRKQATAETMTCECMVGVTRFELVTSSVSGKRSPPELNARSLGCALRARNNITKPSDWRNPQFEKSFARTGAPGQNPMTAPRTRPRACKVLPYVRRNRLLPARFCPSCCVISVLIDPFASKTPVEAFRFRAQCSVQAQQHAARETKPCIGPGLTSHKRQNLAAHPASPSRQAPKPRPRGAAR